MSTLAPEHHHSEFADGAPCIQRAAALGEFNRVLGARERLLRRLATPGWRVAAITGAAGFGKSALVVNWACGQPHPCAWVDAHARPLDAALLGSAASRQRRGPGTTVIIDDALVGDPLLDELVDIAVRDARAPRVVITARGALGRAASDKVLLLDERDLGLGHREAVTLARALVGTQLSDAAVHEINALVGGWPGAFQLAVSATLTRPRSGTARAEHEFEVIADLIADFLSTEVLGPLDPEARRVARDLSVSDSIDRCLATAVAGAGTDTALAELRRRGILQARGDGRVRFHQIVRRHLEGELRWHDPQRHQALHRAAAHHWRERGELDRAYRHLAATGDPTAPAAVVLAPALARIDAGNRAGLLPLLESLPAPSEIRESGLAFDLAVACLLAGQHDASTEWRTRGELLAGVDPPASVAARLHGIGAMLDLMDGDIAGARRHLHAYAGMAPRDRRIGAIDTVLAAFAACVELAHEDVPTARRWIDVASAREGASLVDATTVPGLEAWADVMSGMPRNALEHLATVSGELDDRAASPHHARFETLVVAAWAHLTVGELTAAERLSRAAMIAADALRADWQRARAGEVATLCRLLVAGPAEALPLVRTTRLHLRRPNSPVAVQLALVEATVLQLAGRLDDAAAALGPADSRPRNQLRRASILLERGDRSGAAQLLDGHTTWLPPEQIEAALLLGVIGRDPSRIGAALRDAATAELVAPLLLHGGVVEQALLELPIERLHPRLAAQLRHRSALADPRRTPEPIEALTLREHSIVELLPSHLTYAQIATRLHLSVNTVKGNLKSIYRKVGATSRAEAVDLARRHGLL